jgi:hypothetical protein
MTYRGSLRQAISAAGQRAGRHPTRSCAPSPCGRSRLDRDGPVPKQPRCRRSFVLGFIVGAVVRPYQFLELLDRADRVRVGSNGDCGPGSSTGPLVELRGLEPLTPCMPCKCATSCATAPKAPPSLPGQAAGGAPPRSPTPPPGNPTPPTGHPRSRTCQAPTCPNPHRLRHSAAAAPACACTNSAPISAAARQAASTNARAMP